MIMNIRKLSANDNICRNLISWVYNISCNYLLIISYIYFETTKYQCSVNFTILRKVQHNLKEINDKVNGKQKTQCFNLF